MAAGPAAEVDPASSGPEGARASGTAMQPTQHFFQSQRLRLSYWSWGAVADPGDESQPPLVLVHGGRDHARSWDGVAEAFRADYHVAGYDLRGHGDSQWATGSHYSVSDHLLDLIAFVDVLGGRASVIGHSFGGLLVTLAAGLFPERFERVVAIEGSGARIHRRRDATPDALREWVERVAIEGSGARIHRRRDATPDALREWVERTRGYERRMPRVYASVEAAAERMRQVNPRLLRELSLHLARHATRSAGDPGDAGHPSGSGYVWKFDNWVDARPPVELRPEETEAIWAEVRVPVLLLIGAESHQRGHQDPEDAAFFADGRALEIERAGSHWPGAQGHTPRPARARRRPGATLP